MKFYFLALAASLLILSSHAQNVGINNDHSTPDPNAMLDVKASNKGILVPRMSTANRLAIPNTKGLLVYDSTSGAFFVNTGIGWKVLLTSPGYWTLSGNEGIGAFLGTTDSSALLFRDANEGSGSIDSKTGNTNWGFSTDSVYIVDSAHNNNNTAIGYKSLTENVSGSFNTMLGMFSMPESKEAGHNTGMGWTALGHNITGTLNVAIGSRTLRNNLFGIGNTATGPLSLFNPTNSNYNTGNGYGTLERLTSGSYNTAIGNDALLFADGGSNNTAFGYLAITGATPGNTGSDNTAVGQQALTSNTTGNNNTASGFSSLLLNTTGSNNTAVGSGALRFNVAGNNNVGIGDSSLHLNTTGNNNTAVGTALVMNRAGNFNTGIGYHADVSGDSLVNATVIGTGAIVNASNKIRIGNTSVTSIEGQVPFSTPSDGRFKYDVAEDVKGLDFILQLRPVTYLFNDNKLQHQLNRVVAVARHNEAVPSNIRRSGFIAQEVEKAAQRAGYDFSGVNRPGTDRSYYTLSYESFVIPLVKGMQQQQQLIDTLNSEIKELELQATTKRKKVEKIAALQKEIDELAQTLNKITSTDEKN